ncbi:MAG: phosphatase PAP2 family protein [Chitinophagaceae bacterium]|nr:phosphatase PAP2 family protein [Chitinophagaceae bacterium]
MFTKSRRQPELRLAFLTTLLFSLVFSCFSQIQPDAGNWKTWIVSANEVTIAAPPTKEQTQKELAAIKEKLSKQDDKTLQQIKYWDAGSPSYRWNEIASSMISMRDIGTFFRTPTAWMNMAIYDATVAAWKAKYSYLRKHPSQMDATLKPLVDVPATPSYPCEHTVTAAAAANVLAYFFPAKADSIFNLAKEASQSRINAGVQFPSDVDAAWKLGEQVALKIIEQAKKDGSDAKWTGTMNADPKRWRGETPIGVMAGTYKPIVLKSGDQFRPAAPPDFANDMQQLKSFKQNSQSIHTAYHWASVNSFEFWTQLVSQKIFENRMDRNTPACARIYSVLNVALHEATIVIMDAKYAYWGIRPFQYDTTYKPLLFTPPFPGYPSGHATASSTAATVLEYYFPADAGLFRKIAKECADSRFYGGIHFQIDNTVGLEVGRSVGNYVAQTQGK